MSFNKHFLKGVADKSRSAFHIPNAYAAAVAKAYPERFAWCASIHPYRLDGPQELEQAKIDGALAVKWLPQAMGINPASPLCDRFYKSLVKHNIPLICHTGEEKAVHGGGGQELGNPLKLRRALDHGVRVIVAHCASMGEDIDLDAGLNGPIRPSFDLFTRLMDEDNYKELLFGGISATVLVNRSQEVLARLLDRTDWHSRLLNGSDYPLPGVKPVIWPGRLAQWGYLDETAVPVLKEIREYNPLLFDFVLKRSLNNNGKKFGPKVFETASFFQT
ncbi:MAG: amidohydrolase family protein [Magnetococcales bacterium]|nr:amidohydrolase family protein [Magnetococcales bacterium]